MRRIQILSIIIFIIALVVFGGGKVYEFINDDYSGPQITMNEESITVSSAAQDEELLAGVRAEDKKDGDVSDSLIVETKSNFIEKGRRMITIAAFDSDNHVTKVSREVVYSDYVSPRFSLSKPLRFPVGTNNILEGMSAQDVLDGDITGNIKVSTEYTLQASEAGDYPMVFTVSNSAGDVVSLPVTVEIYDTSEESQRPQIELSSYLVYTGSGTSIDPWDYVLQITMDGREYIKEEDGVLRNSNSGSSISESSVTVSQEIDYNTPGVYEITYEIADNSGVTGSVRLIVVVSE